jgi:hypothetical protein
LERVSKTQNKNKKPHAKIDSFHSALIQRIRMQDRRERQWWEKQRQFDCICFHDEDWSAFQKHKTKNKKPHAKIDSFHRR